MIFDRTFRYPIKFDINNVDITPYGNFKYRNADRYVDFLRKEIKCDIDMECKIAVYGMMFRRIEISLKECSPFINHAEYLISSIVQYEPPTSNWICGDVILRMVEGVALLQFEHVFAQILKYNPLTISRSRMMLVLFTYGTYKMMEIVLDLREPDLIDLTDDDDNIPEYAVEIELCQPNPMCSEGSRLFMNRFNETIVEYEKEHGFAVVGLIIKKEEKWLDRE